jgi:hypothetical protein
LPLFIYDEKEVKCAFGGHLLLLPFVCPLICLNSKEIFTFLSFNRSLIETPNGLVNKSLTNIQTISICNSTTFRGVYDKLSLRKLFNC